MFQFLNDHWWTLGFGTIVQLVLFLRWLYRRIRTEEMTRVFVEDMATNHLPHIYDLLLKICDEQGIDRAQPPRIRWIDLGGFPAVALAEMAENVVPVQVGFVADASPFRRAFSWIPAPIDNSAFCAAGST